MTGTTREAKSQLVHARVADEATKVAVPVIVRARPVGFESPPQPLEANESADAPSLSEFPTPSVRRLTPRSPPDGTDALRRRD